MFAVTGASGQLGRLTVHHLRERVPAREILALTRHPEQLADLAASGVMVRQADFADPTSLPAAFAGTTRALIISTSNLLTGPRIEQHLTAVEAAVRAGVQHITYTSALGADPNATSIIMRDHGLTEAALAASGISWTALRNSFYAEGLRYILTRSSVEETLLFPEGDAAIAWVTREDCARVAAILLAGATDLTGTVDVTGLEGLSFDAVAARLASLQGRAVPVRRVSDEEYVAHLRATGMPEPVAAAMGDLAATIARSPNGAATDTVERLTGTPATSIDNALRALIN